MTIPVQQSLAGFIASDAEASFTNAGITQVRFRVGEEHWCREQDRTFARLDNTFHDLVIFGTTAEGAADPFREGDRFVAHGYVDTQFAEPPGQPADREVYVAHRIGHHLARTAYDITRTPTTRQGEALAPARTESGRPPAEQKAPPTSTPAANHPVSLRSDASPRHGTGL